jgi:hypothetical protein
MGWLEEFGAHRWMAGVIGSPILGLTSLSAERIEVSVMTVTGRVDFGQNLRIAVDFGAGRPGSEALAEVDRDAAKRFMERSHERAFVGHPIGCVEICCAR